MQGEWHLRHVLDVALYFRVGQDAAHAVIAMKKKTAAGCCNTCTVSGMARGLRPAGPSQPPTHSGGSLGIGGVGGGGGGLGILLNLV